MSQVHDIDPSSVDEAAVGAAVSALARGGLVVFPTETVYGIGSRPDDPGATRRLFTAKRRPTGLNLPVIAASKEAAWHVAGPDHRAERLAEAFWPGPLTLILSRTERSRPWYLGREAGTIGVRVPDHPVALALLRSYGPIAATSANLSGRPPLVERDEVTHAFGTAVEVYLLVTSGMMSRRELPSTVLDLTGEAPRLLRRGPLDAPRLEDVLGEPIQATD